MVSSRVYPDLERKPGGPDNWVEAAGGLPSYIERIAKHLHYEQGFTISHAIATAVNTVKRWARMGKMAKYGDPNNMRVTPKTAALAAKAVAEWEAKKRAGDLRLSDEVVAAIDLVDTLEGEDGAAEGGCATLYPTELDLAGGMDLKALAQRAGQISDPQQRAAARQTILDLAGPPITVRKELASEGKAMPHGGFPIRNVDELKKAIRAIGRAKDPASAKRHIVRRARALGATDLIPDSWQVDLAESAVAEIVDLASTIPPRNARGRATDGRKSFKGQGRWKHGFVPVTQAAAESKSKGSPIAMKRMKRLFGDSEKDKKGAPNKFPQRSRAAQGRAGNRSGTRKSNPTSIRVDEKNQPGSEGAKDIAHLRRTKFADNAEAPNAALPESQKEASKSTRIPKRARQNWNEIPDSLKTVRNGKRYVLAEFGGKQYVTEWVGGVRRTEGTALANRKVMRTLSSVDAANMSESELQALVRNPRSSEAVKRTARKALRAERKSAS